MVICRRSKARYYIQLFLEAALRKDAGISAGAGGRLQVGDPKTGETFLYRYSFGPGAWLDLLPDGRFDCSPEALRYLGYTKTARCAIIRRNRWSKSSTRPRQSKPCWPSTRVDA
jgi:hypothetical protein